MAPDNEDLECMKLAIEVSRKCRLEKADAPMVGAVARLTDGTIVSAYRGEHVESYDRRQGLGDHAEYTLLEKKLPNERLAGATIYSTLEPCTDGRTPPKLPCVKWLIDRRVRAVWIGMLDPDVRIQGNGQRKLDHAGIETQLFPKVLRDEIAELNRHFIRAKDDVTAPSPTKPKQSATEESQPVERSHKPATTIKQHKSQTDALSVHSSTNKTTMAIVAHCDDLELGVGGAIAKLADSGWDVHVVVVDSQPLTFSTSDITDQTPSVKRDSHLEAIETREAEGREGAKIIGIKPERILFLRASLDADDGEWQIRSLVSRIHNYCERNLGSRKPLFPFVFTHTRHDRHRHHVLTNTLSGQAFKVPLLCFKVSSSSDSRFKPVIGVDVTPWIDRKVDAFMAHKSQQGLRFSDGQLAVNSICDEAKAWSSEIGFEFGELFECELTDRTTLNQVLALVPLFDSKYHFELFQRQILSSIPKNSKIEWLPKLVLEREQIIQGGKHESVDQPIRLTPSNSVRDAIMSGRFPSFFSLTAIDGCAEIFATPNEGSRYAGYRRDQVECKFVAHHWDPSRDSSESDKIRDTMLSSLRGWLNQRSRPKLIATLRNAPLTPLTDRQEVRLVFGSSDYFTVRTITQLIRDGGISGLAQNFSAASWWADSDTNLPIDSPPFHVSAQAILLNCDPSDSQWSLLLTGYRGRIAPIAGGISVGIAEQMRVKSNPDAEYWWRTPDISHDISDDDSDSHIFDTIERGLKEELGLEQSDYSPALLLNSSLEADMFFVTFLFLVTTNLSPTLLYQKWHSAPDRDESAFLALYPLSVGPENDLQSSDTMIQIVRLLAKETIDIGPYIIPSPFEEGSLGNSQWHHSSRMRLFVLSEHLWPTTFSRRVLFDPK